MDRLYRQIAQFSKLHLRQDDDLVDRLNYFHTCIVLVLFSIIVSTKQYVGEPIQCWTPAHFKGGHDKYANDVCWVANTYWLPMTDPLSDDIQERKSREISYYQYVPFLLLLQVTLFYLPCLIWRTFSSHSGINVKSIVSVAVDVQNLNPDHRQKTIKYLTRHVELCLDNQREYRSGRWTRCRQQMAKVCCLICGRRYGNMLCCLMLFCKLLNVSNAIGELFLMKVFLGANHTWYGVELMADLLYNGGYQATRNFPRVTMCDFEIRLLGNVHRYTVQCVLPINLFHEKMFIFLWFWILFLAIINTANWLSWISNVMCRNVRSSFVKKYLKILNIFQKSETKLIDRFSNDYLRKDGLVVLRLVAINAGDLVAADMIHLLWTNWKSRPGIRHTLKDDSASDPFRPSKAKETPQ